MGIITMTAVLILLTMGAGCLLWRLLLHFEEIHSAAEHETSRPKVAALMFLALAGFTIVGTLAVLLVEVQQLFMLTAL
jgi:uncharacterized membrane protein YidH (DUF202 family)